VVETGDLVGRLGCVQGLKEDHPIHRYHGVVLGDDLLGGYVQYLLHHVLLGADPVDEGDDGMEARGQGAGVASQPLYRIFGALRDLFDAQDDDDEREHDDADDDDFLHNELHDDRYPG